MEVGACRGAQGRVQDGPTFGGVDGLAAEQARACGLDPGGAGQIQTGVEPGTGPALFRQIEIKARRLDRHPAHPAGVGGELVHDAGVGVPCGGGVEGSPVGHSRIPIAPLSKVSFTGRA